MRAHTISSNPAGLPRDTQLRRQIAQLEAELEHARERLHETQRAVHNAGQVLAIARVERHLAAMEVAGLADRLERLQQSLAGEPEAEDAPANEPEGESGVTLPRHAPGADSRRQPW